MILMKVNIIWSNFHCLDVKNPIPERGRLCSDIQPVTGQLRKEPLSPPPLTPEQEGTHVAFAIAGVGEAPRTLHTVRPKKPFAAARFL